MKIINLKNQNAGFTLVESMAALVIMGVTFAYSLPIFFYSHVKILSAQARSNATLIMERVATEYATKKTADLPFGGTPIAITDPEILKTQGKIYEATIEFCPLLPPPTQPNETVPYCEPSRPNYRTAKIVVGRNGRLITSQIVGFVDKNAL
jgi:prepilin-type N-terminal cleavage/methylation domain-containing protein